MELSTTIRCLFQVSASPDAAFTLLADVPDSVAHFPEIISLTAEGGGVYTWRLAEQGLPPVSLSLIYACRYTSDRSALIVRWVSMSGVGNARVSGRWRLAPSGGGTEISLETTLIIEAPIPRFTRRLGEKVLDREQHRLIDGYVENLTKTLRGGDGRLR